MTPRRWMLCCWYDQRNNGSQEARRRQAAGCCGPQSAVVNVFLISPASAGISNYSLVEMSFNLAKSEKAKGQ